MCVKIKKCAQEGEPWGEQDGIMDVIKARDLELGAVTGLQISNNRGKNFAHGDLHGDAVDQNKELLFSKSTFHYNLMGILSCVPTVDLHLICGHKADCVPECSPQFSGSLVSYVIVVPFA
ncbi:hypothetical protein H4582DRAFT_2058438 [Lactarius indigo]|nr:hypothetical protein H4582DRAFT_2058438 [Lactarius indigo]